MMETLISLDDRLFVPQGIRGLLFDLDGTLVSSFEFDVMVCSKILSDLAGRPIRISEEVLGRGFALSGFDFWTFLFTAMDLTADIEAVEAAYGRWAAMRSSEAFPLNEGVLEILNAAKQKGFASAVVSNNPEAEVVAIVNNSGLAPYFDQVIGNDGSGRAKKPAPDSYLYAAARLGLDIAACAILEDSTLGLQAGANAKGHVIAVATGSETYAELKAARIASQHYSDFSRCVIEAAPHMTAACRTPEPPQAEIVRAFSATLGVPIACRWTNDNYSAFGAALAELAADPVSHRARKAPPS